MNNEELIKLAKRGDDDAKEQLFIQNQKYIYDMAHKYRNVGEFDDLVSIGNIGLLKAYNAFDVNKGVKFITLFSRTVTNELINHYRKMKRCKRNASLDEAVAEDSDGNQITLLDLLYDQTNEYKFKLAEDRHCLNKVITEFAKKEKQQYVDVLRLRIMQNKTQKEVGKHIGVTRAMVGSIEKSVKERLLKYQREIS